MHEQRFAMADLTGGQMNAIVKKLGGKKGAERFLRDELVVWEPNIIDGVVQELQSPWRLRADVGPFVVREELRVGVLIGNVPIRHANVSEELLSNTETDYPEELVARHFKTLKRP